MVCEKKNRLNTYFIFVIFIAIISCKNNVEEVNRITKKKLIPTAVSINAEILYSDSAKLKIKLLTPKLCSYQSDTNFTEFPLGINVTFFGPDDKPTTTMKAKYAIKKDGSKLIEAKNDVEVVNVKGEKLNTEHLIWDQGKETILSNQFVKITTADEVIMGDGLESNQDFTNYRIKKIKGIISLKE